MKKMISFALALIMVLVLVACGDNPASNGGNTQNETVTLRASTPTAPEHPWSKCLDNIAAQIKEKTNGRYQIDVYYNASLSENSEKTMTEQIMTGTLDLRSTSRRFRIFWHAIKMSRCPATHIRILPTCRMLLIMNTVFIPSLPKMPVKKQGISPGCANLVRIRERSLIPTARALRVAAMRSSILI